MKFIKLASLLLLLSILFTGCIQISIPPSQRPSEKTDPVDTDENNTRPKDTEEVTKAPEPVLDERGSVSSTESESVVLRADWRAVSYDGKTAEVTVSVYLTYGKLSKGKSTGEVTLNGQKKTFNVKAIEKQAGSKATINPANFTFTVAISKSGTTELDLKTVWGLNATVDGTYVEDLNASASFPLWTASDLAEEEGSTSPDSDLPTPKSEEEPTA